MCNHYCKIFEVYYHEVDTKQAAAITTLLDYLQETATCHSESVGYGIDVLKSQKMAWILLRWHVEIERYPRWKEKVTIETWPSNFEHFYATREFLIRDADGNIIGRAESLWVFLNVEKKRPARISPSVAGAYHVKDDRVFTAPFTGREGNEAARETEGNESFTAEREFSVLRRDIDTNNHVNNVKYVEWMLEDVPQEVYDHYRISSLEVHYKKETCYGTTVSTVHRQMESDGEKKVFLHSIRKGDDVEELARIKAVWVKI